VDGFTGAYRLLRTDILQDVGDSISPVVDRGQTEGGFIQGVGWLTLEELIWDDEGRAGDRRRVHLQAAVVVRSARPFRSGVSLPARRSQARSAAAKP
jgi:xanthine dehydrogenase molybdopterin-binding subunit B